MCNGVFYCSELKLQQVEHPVEAWEVIVRVVPVAPDLAGAPQVGGLPVKELYVGSSPTLPAK